MIYHQNKTNPLFVFRCIGSITIFHYDRNGKGTLPNLKRPQLHKSQANLKNAKFNQKNREVLKVQSEGDCCWRLFSGIRFRGQSHKIHTGFDGSPNNNIKSIKKIIC